MISGGKDAKLVLVGGGGATGETHKKRYEQLIDKLGIGDNLLFIPPTSSPEKMLNMFDVFVLSSICEGCSNVILEAMSCGIPVIATDTGGNPELIDEKRNGLLFDVGNDKELSEKLALLYSNPGMRKVFSEEGLRIIKEKFSLDKTVRNYENLFENLFRLKVKS